MTKSNTWFDGESTARLQTFRARNPTMRDTVLGCPRAQLPEIFVSPPEESIQRLEEVRTGKVRNFVAAFPCMLCNVHLFVRLDRY